MVQPQMTWSATVQTGAQSFKRVAVEGESMREALDRASEFGVVTACVAVVERRGAQRAAA